MSMTFVPSYAGWVRDNLNAGASAQALVEVLVFQHGYTAKIAQAIVEAAQTEAGGSSLLQSELFTQVGLPTIGSPAPKWIEVEGRKVPVILELLHPRILVFKRFATPDHVADLMRIVNANEMLKSTTMGSQSKYMLKDEEPALRLRSQIAKVFDWNVDALEHLLAQRYEVGEEFDLHNDFFNPKIPSHAKKLADFEGNQRTGAFIVYLGEPEEGGGTYFGNVGLRVQLEAGDAVYFSFRAVDDGSCLHAGEPVIRGQKTIITAALRERALPSWYLSEGLMRNPVSRQ